MLKLKDVKKTYKDFELDCSMEVRPGMITGVVGKNGAGKTTTLKAILGLIKTDGGTAEVLGKPVEELGKAERAQLGVVMADSGFSGYLEIRDLMPMLERMYPRFERDVFLEKCKQFHLSVDKKIKEFSTGMRQKLHVLFALSHDARLLILDEPTAGMDVLARDEILDMFREYMEEKEDRSMLISSHIAGDLENLCDDIYMIDDGRVIFHEETDALLGEYALLKMTEEQYQKLDKSHVLRFRKENYGYSCLTDQKAFYLDNYPFVTVENNGIDKLITMMIRGERI